MEYALGASVEELEAAYAAVLILIVMEYALGGSKEQLYPKGYFRLNPYCNGICSRSYR